MRVFVSIELPEEVKREVLKSSELLEKSGLVSGNFVIKDNYHLTLKFLGNLDEDKVNEIEERLSEIDFPSFAASTGEIGFFPSEKYVKVIWVGLNSDKILELKKIIDDKLNGIGVQLDGKDFSSHVTLARIKGVKNRDEFLKKLKEIKMKSMEFKVNKISLIKSELMKSGPVYKILKEFKLK